MSRPLFCVGCGAPIRGTWFSNGAAEVWCSSHCSATHQQMRTSSRDISAAQLYAAGNQANALRGNQNADAMNARAFAAGSEQAALAQQQANALHGSGRTLAVIQDQIDAQEAAVGADLAEFRDRMASGLVIEAQKKRITELERDVHNAKILHQQVDWEGAARWAEAVEQAKQATERASRLSDEAGALRTEMRTVKAELCDALREVERLKRKAGAR